jgi:uncharacterized protein (TIGR00730 family)
MNQHICVYCSSSNALAPEYFEAANQMGRLIASHNDSLVYGGGNVGLMGAVARAVHSHNGKVIGMIPEHLADKEIAYHESDELIITKTMRERKALMEARADVFVSLPGGFGTLEELLEILTLRHLKYHTKPIILVNTKGFYDRLIGVFDQLIEEKFAKDHHRLAYHVTPTPQGVYDYLQTYQPYEPGTKWF